MARGMAPFIALLALLPCIAHALSQNSPSILSFASFAVPPNQAFSVAAFPLNGGQGFAVISNGEPYGVFSSGIPFFEDKPLTSPDKIEAALAAYYSSMNYSPNITFYDIHAGLVSVMANHEKGEAKCRLLTGTDTRECRSFETCQKACYSVTSFCLSFALGSGRTFVNEIWEFENESLALDEAYQNESVAYSATQDGITPAEARAYLAALIGLNRAATAASNNALFDGYSFCFKPDYALPVVTNMQLTAQKRYQGAEPYFMLSETALQVRSRTLAALAREAAWAADAEAAARAAQAAKGEAAGQNASGIAKNETSPPGSASGASNPLPRNAHIPLIEFAALAIVFAAAGAYLLMWRRKGK